MVELTLQRIRKIYNGQNLAQARGSRTCANSDLPLEPDDGQNPVSTPVGGYGQLRADGFGRADQIKSEIDQHLPSAAPAREFCGSCAMNIDGINTLACIYGMDEIRGDVKIAAPYARGQDLIPDLTHFYARHAPRSCMA